MLGAILKANTVWRPVETGHKIQYSALLRRVAKDQDCSAPYVGEDFTEYQRAIKAISKANTVQCPVETGRKIQYSAQLSRKRSRLLSSICWCGFHRVSEGHRGHFKSKYSIVPC